MNMTIRASLDVSVSESVASALLRFCYSREVEVSTLVEFALARLLLFPDDEPMQWDEIVREMRERGFDRVTRALTERRVRAASSPTGKSSNGSNPHRGLMGGLQERARATSA